MSTRYQEQFPLLPRTSSLLDRVSCCFNASFLLPLSLSLSVSYSIFCSPPSPFFSAALVEFSFIRAIILLTLRVQISTTVDYYPDDRRNYNRHPLALQFSLRYSARRKILRKRFRKLRDRVGRARLKESRILMDICLVNVATIILLRMSYVFLCMYTLFENVLFM